MSPLENESMELSDGRTLSYAVYGNTESDMAVIYMHSFPSSRYEGKIWHSACETRGIRLVVPDRPGSGRSTFQTNRKILDWPIDVAALADQLKIDRFYLLGLSGGSPYVLACINSLPKERILGGGIVSGLYPPKFGTEGMMIATRIMLWAAPWMTGLTSFLFDTTIGKAARNKDPKVLEAMMGRDIGNRHPGDREALNDPANWPNFVAMTRESFYQDSKGAGWEARLVGSDWGFEIDQLQVGEVGVPLTLWHGTADVNCPVGMAQKANDLISGSELHLKEGDGHVNFVFRDGESILDGLVGKK
ncbi:Alpha/Beta hydrolase protein [Dendryphion nanum]|uniref:Alpha/Beta hydrolase protein n=1 Tax=Dendryphion nanum TaxID=256645 RepID=A0A9P9DN47_9PLEO|nr:Alpha/Beta hydrolase protein [Dendryphion nanum]